MFTHYPTASIALLSAKLKPDDHGIAHRFRHCAGYGIVHPHVGGEKVPPLSVYNIVEFFKFCESLEATKHSTLLKDLAFTSFPKNIVLQEFLYDQNYKFSFL